MSNPLKATRGQWAYFCIFALLIGFATELLWVIRMVMGWITKFYFSDGLPPTLTNWVIFSGPDYLESNFAAIIIMLTTFIGLAVILKGQSRMTYIANAPLAATLGVLLYLMILFLGFLMPFVPVFMGLNVGYVLPHVPTHRLSESPPPDIPPMLWLIGSLMYLLIVVAGIIALKRREKADEQTEK